MDYYFLVSFDTNIILAVQKSVKIRDKAPCPILNLGAFFKNQIYHVPPSFYLLPGLIQAPDASRQVTSTTANPNLTELCRVLALPVPPMEQNGSMSWWQYQQPLLEVKSKCTWMAPWWRHGLHAIWSNAMVVFWSRMATKTWLYYKNFQIY